MVLFFLSSLSGITSFIISSVYVCVFTVLFFMRLPRSFLFLWIFPENQLINIPIIADSLSSLINSYFYLYCSLVCSTFHKIISAEKAQSIRAFSCHVSNPSTNNHKSQMCGVMAKCVDSGVVPVV